MPAIVEAMGALLQFEHQSEEKVEAYVHLMTSRCAADGGTMIPPLFLLTDAQTVVGPPWLPQWRAYPHLLTWQ